MTAYTNTAAIKASYAPYDRFAEFEAGYADYLAGRSARQLEGVAAQAYDRGFEAGMKVAKSERWIAQNVGAN